MKCYCCGASGERLKEVSATSGVLECERCSAWQIKDSLKLSGTREVTMVDTARAVAELNGGTSLMDRLENYSDKIIFMDKDTNKRELEACRTNYCIFKTMVVDAYCKHTPQLDKKFREILDNPLGRGN